MYWSIYLLFQKKHSLSKQKFINYVDLGHPVEWKRVERNQNSIKAGSGVSTNLHSLIAISIPSSSHLK